MAEKKKSILIDVDSTVNDHWRRIRRWTEPRWPGKTINPKAFTKNEVSKDRPATYALLNIVHLARFYKIGYLTARGWLNAYEITVEWLRRFCFPGYDWVICVDNMNEKLRVLQRERPDFFVDDFTAGQENAIPSFNKGLAESIQNLGISVVVYRGCWPDVVEQIKLYEKGFKDDISDSRRLRIDVREGDASAEVL